MINLKRTVTSIEKQKLEHETPRERLQFYPRVAIEDSPGVPVPVPFPVPVPVPPPQTQPQTVLQTLHLT